MTGLTGAVEGKCSYAAYGTPTCEGSAAAPLGYDGQYTSSDTGLIYLRAREYDPTSAQLLSRDPFTAISGAPYGYADDNPLNKSDPTGLLFGISLPSWEEVGEGIAGWGDTITLGGTEWVREQLGDNNDPQYPKDEWAKVHHEHINPDGTKIIIHYWENLETSVREGFKFK